MQKITIRIIDDIIFLKFGLTTLKKNRLRTNTIKYAKTNERLFTAAEQIKQARINKQFKKMCCCLKINFIFIE